MPPTTIRSLGATAPSRPMAELGMIAGAMKVAADADSVVFKNPRRLRLIARLTMIDLLIVLISLRAAACSRQKRLPGSSQHNANAEHFPQSLALILLLKHAADAGVAEQLLLVGLRLRAVETYKLVFVAVDAR